MIWKSFLYEALNLQAHPIIKASRKPTSCNAELNTILHNNVFSSATLNAEPVQLHVSTKIIIISVPVDLWWRRLADVQVEQR